MLNEGKYANLNETRSAAEASETNGLGRVSLGRTVQVRPGTARATFSSSSIAPLKTKPSDERGARRRSRMSAIACDASGEPFSSSR